MAAALIGNIMVSNIRTNISATTATGVTSGANQVLASNILANPTLGSGNYTYQWSQSGTAITFTAATSNSTNCTYGSLSVAGSTTIFCTVTDTWTGVKSVTANCVLTWPVQTITQNIVISGSPTYNGSGQAYTLTADTGPAPTGSPASFTNAGTYTYPTNITSITPSAGYTIGTVTGSFMINTVNLSVSNFFAYQCESFKVLLTSFDISGFVGAETGSLTVWTGNSVAPSAVALVSTADNSPAMYDRVSSINGANPITIGNGSNQLILYVTKNNYPTVYWVIASGGSNYNDSAYAGPVENDCID